MTDRENRMNLGIYPNLSNEEYHANHAISRSGIMSFLSCPYKYWADYLNPNRPPKKTTDAMTFGSAFHTFVLEPQLFEEQYIIEIEPDPLPDRVLLKNVGRPAYEAYKTQKAAIEMINFRRQEDFEEKAENKIILTRTEMLFIYEMYVALKAHKEAWALIEGATYEQSYFWEDSHTGIICKSRPDVLHSNIIVDLKTCASASSKAYQRSMLESGYNLQAAMVREGIFQVTGKDIPNCINVCIEKTYPYSIGIKIIGPQALEIGKAKFKQALLDMKVCMETNEWPDLQPETVEVPMWAL